MFLLYATINYVQFLFAQTGGQTIPKRIEVMIKGSTKKLNATVENYNAGSFSSASNIPNVVSFVDLKDPESSIYDCLNEEVQVNSPL